MDFEVSWDNYDECKKIYKEIMWMYADMVNSYNGFGHNIDFETIDYIKYIFSYTNNKLQLNDICSVLKEGSLIAICCEAVNNLDDEQRNPIFLNKIYMLLENEKLQHMPYEKEVLELLINALNEDTDVFWQNNEHGSLFDGKLFELYEDYVLGYYKKMLRS